MTDLRFGERSSCLGLINHEPLWQALRGRRQDKFSIRARAAKVLDVGTGQSMSGHKPIGRLSRPAAFHRQRAEASSQRQLSSDHRCRVTAESVRIVSFNLYTRAFAISFTRERGQRSRQPIDGCAAQKIVLRSQIEIAGYIRTPCAARTLPCFSQRYLPCFLEFAHRDRRQLFRGRATARPSGPDIVVSV